MPDHGIELERAHDVDHVLRIGLQRRPASLPGVAAVEQQHLVLAALGADRADQRRQAVDAAHPSVILRERHEIVGGQREGVGRSGGKLEMLAKLLIREMRRQSAHLADAEIDRWFAKVQRHELRVQIGHVKNGHRAERLEAEDVGLRQPLLRSHASERAGAAAGQHH